MSANGSIQKHKSELEQAGRGGPAERLGRERPAEAPAVDIYENKDELLVLADLPGVRQDDLDLHFDKGELRIEGRRSDEPEGHLLRGEYGPVAFRRTFLVPQGIDAEGISAELREGVLRVHLPKAAPFKPRQIQVKAG